MWRSRPQDVLHRRRVDGVRSWFRASPRPAPPPRHRDAAAQPARPWRGCAGQYFRVPEIGGITRFAPPVAATAGVRVGTRGGGRTLRSGTSLGGHFTGMAMRCLHARGAVATGDDNPGAGLGGMARRAVVRRRDRRGRVGMGAGRRTLHPSSAIATPARFPKNAHPNAL